MAAHSYFWFELQLELVAEIELVNSTSHSEVKVVFTKSTSLSQLGLAAHQLNLPFTKSSW